MRKLKISLLSFVLGFQFFAYTVPPVLAQAQIATEAQSQSEEGIKTLLCTPTEGAVGGNNDLVYCVNKLYRFAIAISAVASVFFLVLAGYLRIASDGSSEMIGQSSSIVVSVVAGNIILAFGYVFLRQINPEIVKIKAPVVKEIQNVGNYDPNLQFDRYAGATGNSSGGASYQYTGVAANHTVAEIDKTGGCTINLAAGRSKDKELAQLNEGIFQFLVKTCTAAQAKGLKLSITAFTGCNGGTTCSDHASRSYHYRGCAVDFGDNPKSSKEGKFIVEQAGAAGIYRVNPGTDAEQDNHTHIDLASCPEAALGSTTGK